MAESRETVGILCGEFVQSVSDSINTNDGMFWSLPLFGKSHLFAKTGLSTMSSAGTTTTSTDDGAAAIGDAYKITRYIYCTVKDVPFLTKTGTSWIGYIAESSQKEARSLGRRDIVVAIRGTFGTAEWIKDFTFSMSEFPFVQTPAKGAQVHDGFLSIYTYSDGSGLGFATTSMRDQIFKELCRLLNGDGTAPNLTLPVRITVTGHSLGGALATLVACDVGCNIADAASRVKDNVEVCAITFGSPRVGNAQFKTNIEKHTTFISRYRSVGDPVPWVPILEYVHVGTELVLDWAQSPYVSISIHLWEPFSFKCHNLELYMHVMAAQTSINYSTTDVLYKREELQSSSSRDIILSQDSQTYIYKREELEGVLPPSLSRDIIESHDPQDFQTYYITYLTEMAAWEDDQDRDLLKQELEDVKKYVKDDEDALVEYFREVEYIGKTRGEQLKKAHDAAASKYNSPFGRRDPALLNKGGDILKAKYLIPPQWLVHANKDMVQDCASHRWLPRQERPYDIPTPTNPEYN